MLTETVVHLLRDNFTEGKVRGKKSFLLGRQQLYSLAEFRTLSEIVGFLADTPYGPELSRLQDSSSPTDTEKVLWLSFASTVNNLISTARGSLQRFLKEYVRRFEAYDFATLVIYKSHHKTWEEFNATRHPLTTLREGWLRKLYSLDDIGEVLERLGDEALQSRASGLSLEELTPEKASLVRDILNGWGEERFYNFVKKNLHGRDLLSCLPIVGTTIDLLNVSIILRSKLLGIREVQSHLVPVRWKLDKRSSEELIRSEDLVSALDIAGSLPYYKRILLGARQQYDDAKSLSFLEVTVRKHLLESSRRVLLSLPHSTGIVLAFLYLKENESRNLAAVVSGVAAGLKPEQIRPLVAV